MAYSKSYLQIFSILACLTTSALVFASFGESHDFTYSTEHFPTNDPIKFRNSTTETNTSYLAYPETPYDIHNSAASYPRLKGSYSDIAHPFTYLFRYSSSATTSAIDSRVLVPLLHNPVVEVPLFANKIEYLKQKDDLGRTFFISEAPTLAAIPAFMWGLGEDNIKPTVVISIGALKEELGKIKINRWWPIKESDTVTATILVESKKLQVTIQQDGPTEENIYNDKIEKRVLQLTRIDHNNTETKHEFTHYWLKEWPDRSAPTQEQFWLSAFLESIAQEDGAFWLHCSAGMGRAPTVMLMLAIAHIHKNSTSLTSWAPYLKGQKLVPEMIQLLQHFRKGALLEESFPPAYNFIRKYAEDYSL